MFEHQKGTGVGEFKSSLFKHAKNTSHSIDYENVEIIDGASSDHKLLLKEMLHINQLKPQLVSGTADWFKGAKDSKEPDLTL